MVSKRQQKYMAKRQTNGSRKMRASRRVLKGGRRYLKRELSFGMKKKIRYRTAFQHLIIFYALVSFIIITFVAIVYGDYQSVPWYYYIVAVLGSLMVDIYVLGGRRFNS